jgi:DNA-binding XRE family transcriptional regulator
MEILQKFRSEVVTFDLYRPWKDSDHLRELYHSRGMSQREMAEAMDCRRQTVIKWMDRYDIPTRSVGAHQIPAQLRDAGWVRRQHHELDKSTGEIADEVGCSDNAVRNALSRCDIEHRKRYSANETAQEMLDDEALLRYLHDEKELSQSAIARRIGVHQMTVSRRLREHGIETRPAKSRSGEHNHRWLPQEEMAPTAEYGSERWRRIRNQCLEKHDSQCQRCGITDDKHYGKYGFGLDIHHIRPVSEFDSRDEADRIDNLVPLCRACHEAVEGLPLDIRA